MSYNSRDAVEVFAYVPLETGTSARMANSMGKERRAAPVFLLISKLYCNFDWTQAVIIENE